MSANFSGSAGVFRGMKTLLASLAFLAAATCSVPAFAQERREHRNIDLGVGLDAGMYSPGGTGTAFGGFGVSLRHPIDDRLSIEGTLGMYNAQNASFSNPYDVRTIPVQASVLGYLFPHSPLRVYGVAGATLEHDSVTNTAIGQSYSWNRPGAHMGVGLELQTGRVSWQMDTRYILFGTAPSSAPDGTPAPFQGNDAHLFRMGASMYF